MAGQIHVVSSGSVWLFRSPVPAHEHLSYETKRAAVRVARELAREYGLELVIHNRNGRIAQKDSHGNDPRSVKG